MTLKCSADARARRRKYFRNASFSLMTRPDAQGRPLVFSRCPKVPITSWSRDSIDVTTVYFRFTAKRS
jgi:hypothetical protein